MNQLHVEVSKVIEARPEEVYAVFADYRISHPAILPKPYFTELIVKEGGKGAGTNVDVHMNIYGTKRVFHQMVSEPEPGRVLVETDAEAGVITTFTVDPIDGGRQSQVTITTISRTSPGMQGLVEKLFQPFVMQRIYREELGLLAEYFRHGL